jgi:hypothetical protein
MGLFYVVAAGIGIYVLYYFIRYFIKDYPKVKAQREEEELIIKILNGFNISDEKARILRLLKDSLPEGYRCGRRRCDGILLITTPFDGFYVCSKCHNLRQTVRNVKRVS